MEQGEKIARLRKKHGMTQAELGAALNVTYQAVSKWERGESYPTFDTISQIAKLFSVPLGYFEKDYTEDDESDEEEAEGEEEEEEEEPAPELLGMCKSCGNVVYKGDEAQTSPYLLCKKCKEREKLAAKRKAEEEKRKREEEERARINARNAVIAATKRKRNIGFIVAGLVTALWLIIALIVADSAATIGGNVVFCIFLFTFVSQMIWGGLVREIALKGGVIIGTPGVIFTLDLDGVIFLIAMKVLFAVLRMLVYLIFLLFFVIVAFIISPFTFVVGIIKLNKGIDPDDGI